MIISKVFIVDMEGVKLPLHFENPIDWFIYQYISPFVDFLRSIGVTPNDVSVLSFISALFAIYSTYQRRWFPAIIAWSLNYFFDCMDGMMARRYQMETKFGDILDHATDYISFIGLFIVFIIMWRKHPQDPMKHVLLAALVGWLIITALSAYHINCQEKYVQENTNFETIETLLHIKLPTCSCTSELTMTRFFGTGTLLIYTLLLIILFVKC